MLFRSGQLSVDLSQGGRDELAGVGLFRIRFGATSLTVRALEGEFPSYHQIFAEGHGGQILLDSTEILKRAKLVSAACSEDSRAVRFSKDDAGTLTIRAKSGRKESSAELRAASVVTWPTFREPSEKGEGPNQDEPGFALNPDYLMDVVKAADAECLALYWNDGRSPIEFRSEGFRGVIMTITLD